MENSEKSQTLLEVLVSKAILSQKPTFSLVLRNVLDRGLDINDAVTILGRLQGDQILNVLSITQAANTKTSIPGLNITEELFGPRFDLGRIEQNQLNTNHIIKIEIFPSFLDELKKAGLSKDELDTVGSLFVIDPPPEKMEIHCPIDRSSLCKLGDDEAWQELAKGKVFKCKERRHEIKLTYHNKRVIASFVPEKESKNAQAT